MINYRKSIQDAAIQEDTSREDIPQGNIIYVDQTVFYRTDVAPREFVIILRPQRRLSRGKFEAVNSNDVFDPVASNELFETIIRHLSVVDSVEKIIFQKTDGILHIWTVINQYEDEEKRKAVYAQESSLMKDLNSREYRFDFYLIESNETDEILSSGGIVIFDKGIQNHGKNKTLK